MIDNEKNIQQFDVAKYSILVYEYVPPGSAY